MSSLSLSRLPRPYQFAVLAVLLVAVLWVAVLHSLISSSSSTPEATTPVTHPTLVLHHPAPVKPAPVTASHPAVPAPTHHAVTKVTRHASGVPTTHHAVGKPTVHHSAPAAPVVHHTTPTAVAHHTPPAAVVHHTAPAAVHKTVAPSHPASSTATKPATVAPTTPAPKTPAVTPSTSHAAGVSGEIETQLSAGKMVLVLFWEPKSKVDQYVQQQVASAAGALHSRVDVHYVLPAQVGELGTWTQKVLIAETPTILMITPSGQVSAVAGFTDAPSIEQSVDRLLGLPLTAPVAKTPKHAAPKTLKRATPRAHH
jgi:hypothetical protein